MERFNLENKVIWYLMNEFTKELDKNNGEYFTTRKTRLTSLRKEINRALLEIENKVYSNQEVIDYENY